MKKNEAGVHMNAIDGKRLINSAVLLTVAALVTKALSIGYRIPYQNITGDLGFYVYQQVYPIHGIVFTLAMYGFPVVISKLLAERASDRYETEQLLSISFSVLTVVSLLSFLVLFSLSPLIARFVGDEQLYVAYRSISFSLLFVPFISVLRGYFQANENVIPTAVSQISEQVVRVIVIVTFAFYVMNAGYGVYVAGVGAAFGSIVGGIASCVALLIFYLRVKRRKEPKRKVKRVDVWKITKALLLQGFVISIGALSLIFFQLIDAMTVINQLYVYGLSGDEAKVLKGVFDRGQPLIQLGFTLATSLSLVIVPAIVNAIVNKNIQDATNKAGFTLKLTFAVSAAASVGLAVIIEPTNVMLFMDSRGSDLLAILGVTIFFGSLTLASIAILQGIGRVNVTLIIVAIGLLFKLLVNAVLIPVYGIHAAAYGTVTGFAMMAGCSIAFVHRHIRLFSNYRFHFLRMSVAVIGMAVIAFLWKTVGQMYLFADGRLGATGIALSTVLIAILVYGSLLLLFRVFSKSELTYFSKVK